MFRPLLIRGGRSRADDGAPDQARRFRELMLPQLDAAYNLARYLARDPTLAEDVVQDAFLRAFRLFDSYRGGDPRAWLLAIVRNCWHDQIKVEQDRRRVLVDHAGLSDGQADAVENHPDPAGDPEAAAILAHETQAIRAVIADIPEPFREALVLREMESLSYREIATVTGVPIGTVMSRLARAREMLTRLLLPSVGDAAPMRREDIR
jgi:RNA polymerase sigma factor (sigma-70 family)